MQTDDARVFAVQGSNGGFQAIETFCRSSSIHSSIPVSSDAMGELSEMTMAIDAATRIRFRGVHYVFYEELGHGLKAKKSEDFNLELSYIMLLLML